MKAKIFLGPAGIPVSSKKGSTLDGIKTVKELGLNAMEIEFVRGVKMSRELAKKVGELASQLNVRLSVHAPYYINLLSEKQEVVEASKKRILDSLDRAEVMNADVVVIHTGYYGKLSKEDAREIVVERYSELLEMAKEMGIKKSKMALETMAKESQFAGLEDILYVVRKLKKKVVPLIDFAHLFARCDGKIDYARILDEIEKLKIKHVNSHFSNMKYVVNKKKFADIHEPMNSHPPFGPLAKEILKRDIDITIISESPILEKDSLKMKRIFEKLGYRFD
ncbi:MAG: TIM barrel protein [Candidatus Aenigmarchaeota archaeon]|nr:TIM barrel protein [Candidatus Aenigmarchaeota archaeon]